MKREKGRDHRGREKNRLEVRLIRLRTYEMVYHKERDW